MVNSSMLLLLSMATSSLVVMGCDLLPSKGALERSFVKDTINAASDPCLAAENCLSGPGERVILRFDSYLENQGRTDCTIGWTPKCPSSYETSVAPRHPFVFDQCHKHWHFTGFSEYYLLKPNGETAAQGQKNGLCLMDVICPTGRPKFTCDRQGISPGCSDIYNKALDCQWIDITDLPDKESGIYTFKWRTNVARLVPETNYDNNDVITTVDLSKIPWTRVREAPAPNQCSGGSAFNTGVSSMAGSAAATLPVITSPSSGAVTYVTEDVNEFDWEHYRSLPLSQRREYRIQCNRNGIC